MNGTSSSCLNRQDLHDIHNALRGVKLKLTYLGALGKIEDDIVIMLNCIIKVLEKYKSEILIKLKEALEARSITSRSALLHSRNIDKELRIINTKLGDWVPFYTTKSKERPKEAFLFQSDNGVLYIDVAGKQYQFPCNIGPYVTKGGIFDISEDMLGDLKNIYTEDNRAFLKHNVLKIFRAVLS